MMLIVEVLITILPLAVLLYIFRETGLYAFLAGASLFLLERLMAMGFGVYSTWMIPVEIGILAWCLFYTVRCRDKLSIAATVLCIVAWIVYRILVVSNPIGIGAMIFLPSIIVWYVRCNHHYKRVNPFQESSK